MLSPILSKLDEEEQRKEWHNILTLGNIEELSRVASDTAGLVTLYYREQIASIDPSEKIESSDMFNSKADWIRDLFYNIRSANSKTMAVVMVAEYVSAWIIEALKAGQNYIIPTESLPHQLWLYVAKQDPVDQKTVTSVVHASAGRQKIRLNIKDSVDHNHKKVELRHLIGCVSVFGNDGTVYQYPMMKNVSASELQDLKIFGYVYVTPFSSNEKALESIVTGRKLLPARRDKLGDIQTRFQEIIQYAETYGMHDDEPSKQSFITAQTADTVARLLRQQKVFADPKDVKDGLRKSEEKMRLRIDVLHEEIQQKSKYYESLVTVTLETLKQQSLENQKTMKKEIDTYYNEISERVTRKIQDFERSLEQLMEKRMEDIKQELRENTKQISKMAEAANAQSLKAITQANQASEFSRKAVEQGAKAIARAEKIEQSNEKRKEELQSTAKNCEATVKQTAITQIEFCERAISKMRTKFEHDMEQAHMAVRESAEIAKQSARVAQQLVSEIKHTQKAAKSQVEAQNQDSQNPRAEVKGARQQYVDTWDSARKVEKEAKQSGNTSAPTNGKIHYSPEKVDKITARL